MIIKVCQRNINLFDFAIRFACLWLVIYAILPHRFASHYSYFNEDELQQELVEQVTKNISLQLNEACDYSEIVKNSFYTFRPYYKEHILRTEEILAGGEYFPENCRSRFSTAILVPYRQREEQLHKFLIYMHNYLRLQDIHYRIFLIEQYDAKPFNRAKLFNIGSIIAAEFGFPCLVLHDVDLLPLNSGQLYVCTKLPRHMCSALDQWRFHLPYRGLFGGVVAITTRQFHIINGMSNKYEGWGGEDDDLYSRLKAFDIDICRFAPALSEYTMLKHKPEKKNENRVALLNSASSRFHSDGLNSLVYIEKERRIHSLFTHILVET